MQIHALNPKPIPFLGPPVDLSEPETSSEPSPGGQITICQVKGRVLTSKSCVPVAVGVNANAERSRTLGPGLAPHTILEGKNQLNQNPGLEHFQPQAEKQKHFGGHGWVMDVPFLTDRHVDREALSSRGLCSAHIQLPSSNQQQMR